MVWVEVGDGGGREGGDTESWKSTICIDWDFPCVGTTDSPPAK